MAIETELRRQLSVAIILHLLVVRTAQQTVAMHAISAIAAPLDLESGRVLLNLEP